jgi:hypothetical protein
MGDARLRLFVLCSSGDSRREWLDRAAHYPDLEVVPVQPGGSRWRALQEIVRDAGPWPVLVCREDIWFGVGFESAVAGLIADLDRQWPGWSVCGNRGAAWDSQVVDYTRFRHLPGLHTGAGPRPLLTIDDDLLLLKPEAFARQDLDAAPLGLAVSLAALTSGVVPLADRRLLAIRTAEAESAAGAGFRQYWRDRFLNDRLPTADGVLDLSEAVDYAALDPRAGRPRADLISLYDAALVATRGRRASVTVCCRTQFKRPLLLRRALDSIAVAAQAAAPFLDCRVLLVTDTDQAVPGVDCLRHTPRPGRHSRADLLLAAIEQASTDYIWFVDDDDYMLPGAMLFASRSMLPDLPVLLTGDAVARNESPAGDVSPTFAWHYRAEDVFRVFDGVNRVPICAMILPVALAQKRLAGRKALGDYNEDYFVLMTLLTSPGLEVVTIGQDLCGISFRGEESSAAEANRERWHLSNCTFLLELLSSEDTNFPLLWQLARKQGGRA